MSSADEAYAEAVRLIAEAKREGVTEFKLYSPNLRSLPPEIGELQNLRVLTLQYTGVTDLSPLSNLAGLTELEIGSATSELTDIGPLSSLVNLTKLSISGSRIRSLEPLASMVQLRSLRLARALNRASLLPLKNLVHLAQLDLDGNRTTGGFAGLTELKSVSELILTHAWVDDLRPLLELPLLLDAPTGRGLTFQNTMAALQDEKIKDISYIQDSAERARALFAYLKDWVPPGEVVPEPDDLLPILLADGRLEIARSLPSEAEIDDRLKRALHERLLPKAVELARVAGNTQGRLAGRARSLADRLDRPFEDLDMINIHMDVEDLSSSLRTNEDRVGEDRYSPDIVDALTDVASIGPGLTLDNVDVEKLEDRKRRFAANPPGAEVMGAHQAFSRAVAADMAAIGDNLRALEARVVEREGEASSGAIQVSTHRDMFIRIGRYSLTRTEMLVIGAAGSGVWQFVYDNRDLILLLANSYGAGFAQWFGGMIAQVADLAGLVGHVELKPILRKREPK